MCLIWKYLNETIDQHLLRLVKVRPTRLVQASKTSSNIRRTTLIRLASKIRLVFSSFYNQLTGQSRHDHRIDYSSGHLFVQPSSPTCHCGLVILPNKGLLDESELTDLDFDRLLTASLSVNRRGKLLDCFESRLNAIRTARDVLSALFQVGVFVHE